MDNGIMDDREELMRKLQTLGRNNRKLREERDRLIWVLEHARENMDHLWLFENREERMDANVPIFSASRAQFHRDRYAYAGDFAVGKVVLDIACGTGYGAAMLSDAGAQKVLGIDVDPLTVRYAQKNYGSDTVKFEVGDAGQLGLNRASFDLIVSFETIEHVENVDKMLKGLSEALKYDGKIIISTPNQWPLSIAKFHTNSYSRDQFKQCLEPYFDIELLLNQNSGSDYKYNHGQPRGISMNSDHNTPTAECFIAVAVKK